jgi:Uma2 family endonuclease
MSTAKPPHVLALEYEQYAREYCASLPLQHFMEATSQGRQREITLESLALVTARRADVQVFNELLVQYPRPGQRKPGQVVPDNMVVVCKEPILAEGSFNLPEEPARPFWVLEYVSERSEGKDYEDSFHKYERELKVPYCLMFHPEKQDLKLYRHNKRKYVLVKPNAQGRLAIPDLELEVALLDGWVRFWDRSKLIPLPPDLVRELKKWRREAREQRRRADEATQRADAERQARLALEQELETLRARLRAAQPPRNNGA